METEIKTPNLAWLFICAVFVIVLLGIFFIYCSPEQAEYIVPAMIAVIIILLLIGKHVVSRELFREQSPETGD